jgi:subtilase family serine protease
MKIITPRLKFSLSIQLLAFSLLAMGASSQPTFAQSSPTTRATSPTARIAGGISTSDLTPLANSQHPLAQAKFASGRLAGSSRLEGISIYFSRTKSQEADLQALIAAQQNPSSQQYHQWLTPEQFASRFGMADADIAKVKSWLEQQGFQVDSVARSRNMIRFSGTTTQVEAAFNTQMYKYSIATSAGVEQHFAPSTALSLPLALAGVVESVHNLNDFRPRAHVVANKMRPVKPAFTSSQSGSVFFAPGDIAAVYDIAKEYNAGITGTGQSITIVGQSAVTLSDIEAFQTAAGFSIKDPTLVLVPGTGSSTLFPTDETESDLDLEWSGSIAKGATIYFIYTGSNTNFGAFDSLSYAVDNKIGTIISSSYGECEADLGGQNLESVLEQATTQGQTVISASGDSGSTDCFVGNNITNPSLTVQESLAVDYPASSPFVTGVGGTEISTSSSDYMTPGDGYWASVGSSDQITSALKYIPEQVWNEDLGNCGSNDCLDSGGGGASTLFTKPSWQTNVSGIPSGNTRFVPDISLHASTGLPGYLFCTSDQSFWVANQLASCNSGFRDGSTGDLTVAGGTSFAAPIFAGMVALVNQQQGYSTGQGLINPMLYTLASDSVTYASAFHDITSGNNLCLAGSSYCSGTQGFTAGVGYDEASGLGSVDLYNLANVWPANTEATLISTTTTVSPSNATPALNASVTFTISVASAIGTTVPTGTVSITVDSNSAITGNTLTANGTFTYTTSFSTSGSHQVLVSYSGDATHAASTGSATVSVPVPVSGVGTFTLSATNLTVTQGSTGSSTITVTPAGGYTGTVEIGFDTSNDNALQNLCYEFTNTLTDGNGSVDVTGKSAVTTQLSFDTNAADCATTAAVSKTGKHAVRSIRHNNTSKNRSDEGMKMASAGIALAGLLMLGFVGRSSGRLRGLSCLILLTAASFAISACGGSSSNTISNPPKGTYTVSLTGQDTSSATIPQASTTFTFTIN